jgi:hypothetical protein
MMMGIGLALTILSGKTPSPPTVLAIDRTLGDTLGGGSRVVFQVDDSSGAVSAALGGVNVTSFSIDDTTHVSGIPGAHAAGHVNATVTNGVGTSSPLVSAYEYWNPAVPMAPTLFAERGDYTTPGSVGHLVARSSTVSATFNAANAGTSPTDSSGAPLFVKANSTHLDEATMAASDWLIGRARATGCTIAVVLDIVSITAQGANVFDNQMVIGDTFQNAGLYIGGSGANKAILDITTAGSVDQQAIVTIPTTGRAVVVGERDSSGTPFVKITADSGPTWTNGPTLASDTDSGGTVIMGKSVYSAGHGAAAQAYLDATVLAVVTVKQGWSDADVTKFFKWAAARYP